MGLKILTTKTKNGSSDSASVLFNSNRMSNLRTIDTNDSYFEYAMKTDDVVKTKYTVDEALATADNAYTAASVTFYTLPVHDDVNDSGSDTTNKAIAAEDIALGRAFGSVSTKSLLWVQEGGKLVKKLVNKPLSTIEDYIMTGTTTTSTTSTSTTSTTS